MTQKETSRRDFLRQLAIVGGGVFILGRYQFLFADEPSKGILKAIIVDFDKCTGCRTCEIVCSSFHHPVNINGESFKGLGNPKLGNIQVYHLNPDVDVPSVCANCPDAPCVEACPTDKLAIFRDPSTGTIRTNHEECLSCGSCARACAEQRTGVIKMSANNQPTRICDQCSGDSQCAKHCPYGAITVAEVNIDQAYFGLSPEKIAEKLIERYYAG